MAHFTSIGGSLGLAILAGTTLASVAAADVVITKSDVPGLTKNMVLKDDAVLDIPAKASVRVMLKPANVTKVIAGPYKGTAKDYAPTTISTAAKKGAPPSSYGGSVGAKPPK